MGIDKVGQAFPQYVDKTAFCFEKFAYSKYIENMVDVCMKELLDFSDYTTLKVCCWSLVLACATEFSCANAVMVLWILPAISYLQNMYWWLRMQYIWHSHKKGRQLSSKLAWPLQWLESALLVYPSAWQTEKVIMRQMQFFWFWDALVIAMTYASKPMWKMYTGNVLVPQWWWATCCWWYCCCLGFGGLATCCRGWSPCHNRLTWTVPICSRLTRCCGSIPTACNKVTCMRMTTMHCTASAVTRLCQ